jgi:hypothetical protein
MTWRGGGLFITVRTPADMILHVGTMTAREGTKLANTLMAEGNTYLRHNDCVYLLVHSTQIFWIPFSFVSSVFFSYLLFLYAGCLTRHNSYPSPSSRLVSSAGCSLMSTQTKRLFLSSSFRHVRGGEDASNGTEHGRMGVGTEPNGGDRGINGQFK